MSAMDPNQRECAILTAAMLEGDLSAEQRERLNTLCREDAACRKLYLGVMSVHGMLMWSSDASPKAGEELDESSAFIMELYAEARVNRIKHDAKFALLKDQQEQVELERAALAKQSAQIEESRTRVYIIPKPLFYGGLVAATLLLMLLVWPALNREPASVAEKVDTDVPAASVDAFARLMRVENAVWDKPISADRTLPTDTSHTLLKGFAEIVMPSGASVIMQGPTTFRLIDDNTMALDDGRLSAEVPTRAKYFTVKTRAMDVVDLGTRFGVSVEADGSSSASVFEGKVEVHEPASKATDAPRIVAMTAGQQLHASATGQLAESVTAIDPDHGYVDRWDAIARHVQVQGQARFYNTPPKSVRQGDLLNTDMMVVFEESTVVLDQPMEVMAHLPEKQYAKFVTIPAGRRVVSYFIHSAPEKSDESSYATATLTFPGRVLGVIGNTKLVRETTDLFGHESVGYTLDTNRSTYGIDPGSPDYFAIGGLAGNVLTIHLAAGEFGDQLRVLVEVPDAPTRDR